jgi:transposase
MVWSRHRRGRAGSPQAGSPGKQPGEPGFTLRQVDDPDEVVIHRPGVCGGCASSLRRAPVTSSAGKVEQSVE